MKYTRKMIYNRLISCTLIAVMICTGIMISSDDTYAATKLKKKKLTLCKGNSYKLKVSGSTKKVLWKSSKKSVATVSKTGKIKAKSVGKTTITATVSGKKMKCKIKVKKHNLYDKIVKPATKKAQGYTRYKCKNCSKKIKKNYVYLKVTPEQAYADMIALQTKYPNGMPWNNCVQFSILLSDAAFGINPKKSHKNFNNIKVGDIIRMEHDTHSVVVLKVNEDSYTIAEGNINGVVRWGRIVYKTRVKETGTYVQTRYI